MWPDHWSHCLPGLALQASHHLPRLPLDCSDILILMESLLKGFSKGFLVTRIHPFTLLLVDPAVQTVLSFSTSSHWIRVVHLPWALREAPGTGTWAVSPGEEPSRWRCSTSLSPPPAHSSCHCPDVHWNVPVLLSSPRWRDPIIF